MADKLDPKLLKFHIISDSLQNEDLIKNAQKLLKTVYIDELAFKYNDNDPAGFLVKDDMLIDHFNDLVQWYIVTYNNEVIACARSIKPNALGLLEMHAYQNYQALCQTISQDPNHILYPYLTCSTNTLEINRAAVHAKFREYGLFSFVLCHMLNQFSSLSLSLITSTAEPKLINFYKRTLELVTTDDAVFKYQDTDKDPAQLFIFPNDRLKPLLTKIGWSLQSRYHYPLDLLPQTLPMRSRMAISNHTVTQATQFTTFKVPTQNPSEFIEAPSADTTTTENSQLKYL